MKRLFAILLVLMLFITSCGFLPEIGDNGSNDQSINIEDSTNSDSTGTDNNHPEEEHPEEEQPEEEKPEEEKPEEEKPEEEKPEEEKPEEEKPEEEKPEEEKPEEEKPETSEHEHSFVVVIIDPTCTNIGYTTNTCSACGDSYTSNEVVALGHSYKSVVTAATCDKSGYTTNTCSACGDSYTSNEVAALGHSYKSVVTAATCDKSGYTTNTCSACGDSYTSNEIAALGHNYNTSVTLPTCDKAGYTTYTCSVCSVSYVSDETAALGHSYKTTVTAATCTNDGYTTYTCSVCSNSYTANIVVAFGHSWKDATTEAPKTCTTCGVTEGEKLPDSSNESGGAFAGYGETLYVNYINVGQGDSILIKVGDCDILIDAGEAKYGSTVSSYLNSKGVDDIELMINTHPDADHCGGLTTVLNNFVVEQVWASSMTKTTAAYKNFAAAVKSEGLTMKTPAVGTVFTYEYLTLTVLYAGAGATDSNDSSIVVMVEYGSFNFLFTGDISSNVENALVSNSNIDLKCDVLKVPHHGSAGSSSASFLSATGAEYGIICVGDNSYGHPTSAALNRLSSANVSVYRTDLNGNIVFSTNGAILYLPGGGTDTSGSGSASNNGGSSNGGSSSGGSSSDTSDSQIFIGNTETKVFHLPTCSNLPAVSKQNTMYNYWWIINIAGYTPCGRCLSNYNAGSNNSSTTYIANSESKVYHLSSCSYLPAASKQVYITNTSGYTPCGHCIGGSSTKTYIANTETKVYHLSTCSYLPAASKQTIITSTSGYTPCGHCIK